MTGRSLKTGAVVDASVAAKWVMAEANAEAALWLLESGIGLSAPAHWLGEAVNAIWAAVQRGDLIEREAHERAAALAQAPVSAAALDRLVPPAMTIALRLKVTMYDALYLALAERLGTAVVSDDKRLLVAATGDRQLRDRVIWIGDDTVPSLLRGAR